MSPEKATGTLTIEETPESIHITGNSVSLSFSKASGEMNSYRIGGKEYLQEGLRPNFWRGLTDNDVANGMDERCNTWKSAGDKLRLTGITIQPSAGKEQVTIRSAYKMPEQDAQTLITYTVYADGVVKTDFAFTPGEKVLPEIPRVGMRMILKGEYDQMTWFGRGPQENYWDRKSGADIDLYKASVWEQYHPYVRAQETANKTDVRWAALQNKDGEGLLVKTASHPLNVSAWNFPMKDIEYIPSMIRHIHGGSIEKKDMVWLNIDSKQMGVGGDNTWGAQTHPEYTITPEAQSYSFYLIPVDRQTDLVKQAKLSR